MSKKGIYRNKKTLTKDTREKEIFGFIKDNKKPVKQNEIAKKFKLSEATVSRLMNVLVGKSFDYGDCTYRVERVPKKGYVLTKHIKDDKPNTPKFLQSVHMEVRKEEEEEAKKLVGDRVDELAYNQACQYIEVPIDEKSNKNVSSLLIPAKVIMCKVKKAYRIRVKQSLLSSLGREFFYDIVEFDEGVYILLKEDKDENKIEEKIKEFFDEVKATEEAVFADTKKRKQLQKIQQTESPNNKKLQ